MVFSPGVSVAVYAVPRAGLEENESVMAATPVNSYSVTAMEEDEREYDVVPDCA